MFRIYPGLTKWKILVFVIAQATFFLTVRADCYSHDGIHAKGSIYNGGPELVSCGNGTSNCCLDEQSCGSNLLCKNVNATGYVRYTREYCENKSWNECSSLCYGTYILLSIYILEGTDQMLFLLIGNINAGVSLTDCGNNVFCCGACDCSNDTLKWSVDPKNGAVVKGAKGFSGSSAVWWSVDSAALLSSTKASTITHRISTRPAATTSISTPSPTSFSSNTDISTPTSSASPFVSVTPAYASSSSRLGTGAYVGIGVGCTLVAGLLGWLLFREIKRGGWLRTKMGTAMGLKTGITAETNECGLVQADDSYARYELGYNPIVELASTQWR
ncbi:hypothetical protein P280DRAFT_470941 [Massarina eburnea CBS 473.64]|uniref:Mid2 domain-containing protein n=1 Tax=Massarina eburnea CBS 473.64 TaxID=1395130 RepID=A0A6A6RTR5_9PLEO|nr:hypothetical protein P280DRAFT_470941 [Massarina eburnea CBS 473.64]